MDLRIAVISDLHCHELVAKSQQCSHILTNIDVDIYKDPHKSFIKLIELNKKNGNELNADILLAPGDYTNYCDVEGFKKGWQITKEMAKELNVKKIYANIGNHDVDSRDLHKKGAFHLVDDLFDDFPFEGSELNEQFKKDGYLFLEESNYRLLHINTVFNHHNEDEARIGLISNESLVNIKNYLESVDKKKFNIVHCHHNLVPYEYQGSGSTDFVHNGTLLIELINEYDFNIIVHGHKHDPNLQYTQGPSNPALIFSSGSFSAYKQNVFTGGYNTFHVITLKDVSIKGCYNPGIVETWFFTPNEGWSSDKKNDYMSHKTGFGCRTPISDLAKDIRDWFNDKSLDTYKWDVFAMDFEMLEYLLPKDQIKLRKKLKEEYDIHFDKDINESPTIITCYHGR